MPEYRFATVWRIEAPIVRTTKWWMNLLVPLARPIFAWNHAYSMRRGSEGLARLPGARLVAITHT